METQSKKRSITTGTDSSLVSGSNVVPHTSGQQEKSVTKPAAAVETVEEPVALKHTGASQDFSELNIGTSCSQSLTESGGQSPSKKLKLGEQLEEDRSCKQSAKNIQHHIIDLSATSLQKCTFKRTLVAGYSRDENGQLESTTRKLDVFSGTNDEFIRPNLLSGYTPRQVSQQVNLPEAPTFSIGKFDEYLSLNETFHDARNRPNFIATVSTLRRLMCAYCADDKWTVCAKQKNEVWYLSEVWQSKNDGLPRDTKYAARMFELLMTNNRSIQDAEEEAEDFPKQAHSYQVRLADLGKHRLLYSGEVDCCDKDSKTIELKTKTCEEIPFEMPQASENDIRNYWAQAYLMESHKIVIGYLHRETTKNKEQLLVLNKHIKELETELIKPCEEGNWAPDNCVACLNTILNHFANEFFKVGVTYKLEKTMSNIIVASIWDQDMPLKSGGKGNCASNQKENTSTE